MAQRVYLIPVQPAILESMTAAILAESDDGVAAHVDACRERGRPQQRALALSREFSARLNEAAFESSNRADEHGLFTAMRPYLITARTAHDAAHRANALYAADEATRTRLFEAELAALPPELCTGSPSGRSAAPHDPDALWDAIRKDLLTARRMREAALSGRAYTHEIARQMPFEGMTVMSPEETEPHIFAGAELAEAYGQLIGATLGRILGLCLPTWWMGRNFWIGLLIASRLSPFSAPPFSSVRALRKTLASRARSPALLVPALEIPGFFENFPLGCEAYSSGLYFGREAVSKWLESFEAERAAFVRLGVLATGYDEAPVQLITSVVHECLLWCEREGYGVMEGDELVGSLGYR